MKLSFDHDGSCARGIEIEVENGRIVSTEFVGGHPGNPQVISALAAGMEISEAITRLRSIACNGNTSCPGRLAHALEKAAGK